MFNYILKNLFIKKKKVVKKPLTIINENRESTVSRRSIICLNKEDKQKTCLSQYFSNIKGLNTIERNIYCKLI